MVCVYMYLELVAILLHPNMAIAGKSPKIQEEMHLQSWWIVHCHVFFGWYASSKILVGHLGNVLFFFGVVCLLPTQKLAKTTGKTTP